MASDLRRQCVFVRIHTGADGWPFREATLTAVAEVPWCAIEVDVHGLRGVLAQGDGEDAWSNRVGSWVRDLAELGEVEVREGVSLWTTDAPLEAVLPQLHALGGALHGVFSAAGKLQVVVEETAAERLPAAS